MKYPLMIVSGGVQQIAIIVTDNPDNIYFQTKIDKTDPSNSWWGWLSSKLRNNNKASKCQNYILNNKHTN